MMREHMKKELTKIKELEPKKKRKNTKANEDTVRGRRGKIRIADQTT